MEPPEGGAAEERGRTPSSAGERASDAASGEDGGEEAAGRGGPDGRPADRPGSAGGAPGADTADAFPIAGLSLPSRIAVAVVLAAVAVGAALHLAMVFLELAPANTLSQAGAKTINAYIYPEFEQNWKLFAPNPLQENSDVQARAEVLKPDGTLLTTGWVDLTAMDDAKILHNPFPSHANQNELRRAWGFFTDTHDDQNRPIGMRGDLSQTYILRIVAHRFGPRLNGGAVQRIQVRSVTWAVQAPPWNSEKTDTRPVYRVLPWWSVSNEDFT